MILVKNTQKKIAINVDWARAIVQCILKELKYQDFDIGIWLTTNATIKKYNALYRGKNKPTDILSFSYHSSLRPGERIVIVDEEDKNLGDLIISMEYVKKSAQDLGQSLEQRLQVLFIHGILHLLGYDHEADHDYVVMHKKEVSLLKKVKTATQFC